MLSFFLSFSLFHFFFSLSHCPNSFHPIKLLSFFLSFFLTSFFPFFIFSFLLTVLVPAMDALNYLTTAKKTITRGNSAKSIKRATFTRSVVCGSFCNVRCLSMTSIPSSSFFLKLNQACSFQFSSPQIASPGDHMLPTEHFTILVAQNPTRIFHQLISRL